MQALTAPDSHELTAPGSSTPATSDRDLRRAIARSRQLNIDVGRVSDTGSLQEQLEAARQKLRDRENSSLKADNEKLADQLVLLRRIQELEAQVAQKDAQLEKEKADHRATAGALSALRSEISGQSASTSAPEKSEDAQEQPRQTKREVEEAIAQLQSVQLQQAQSDEENQLSEAALAE